MDDETPDEQPGEQAPRHGAEHLKPWQFKPGQSGNPNGRPKGTIDLSARIRKELLRKVKEDATLADALAKRIVSALLEDPIKGQRLILAIQDRDEGPIARDPVVSFDFSGPRSPELPPMKQAAGGPPALGSHLKRLTELAQEFGIDLAAEADIAEAEIIDQAEDNDGDQDLADILT